MPTWPRRRWSCRTPCRRTRRPSTPCRGQPSFCASRRVWAPWRASSRPSRTSRAPWSTWRAAPARLLPASTTSSSRWTWPSPRCCCSSAALGRALPSPESPCSPTTAHRVSKVSTIGTIPIQKHHCRHWWNLMGQRPYFLQLSRLTLSW